MALIQYLDPLTWPIPSIYMDVGVWFPENNEQNQNYPLDVYIDADISGHLSTGYNYGGYDCVFMPGHENPVMLCGHSTGISYTITEKNGITVTSGKYTSPVANDGRVNFMYGETHTKPADRWTGRSRLLMQSKHGTGKTFDLDHDDEGIIWDDDYSAFFKITIGSGQVTVTPLIPKIADCFITLLSDNSLPADEQVRVLSLVLSTLEVDGNSSPYTVSIGSVEGDRFGIYGWHWSYTENECSIVTKITPDDWDTTTHFLTNLYSISFTITSGVVSASLNAEEQNQPFLPASNHTMFSYIGELNGEQIVSMSPAMPPFGKGSAIGNGAPAYVFYKTNGQRAVLRYTYQVSSAVDETEPANKLLCTPPPHSEVKEWRTGGNNMDSSKWYVDNGSAKTELVVRDGTERIDIREFEWYSTGTYEVSYSALGGTCASDSFGSWVWVEASGYGVTYTIRINSRQYSQNYKSAVMTPENPDGIYIMENSVGTEWGTWTIGDSDGKADVWKKVVLDHPLNARKPEAIGLTAQDPLKYYKPSTDSSGSTASAAFEERLISYDGAHVSSGPIEAGSGLGGFLRSRSYSNTTETASLKIHESFNGISRYNHSSPSDIKSSGDFTTDNTGKRMYCVGWA